jgi:hypothetical protein
LRQYGLPSPRKQKSKQKEKRACTHCFFLPRLAPIPPGRMMCESGDFKPEKPAIAPQTLSFRGEFD